MRLLPTRRVVEYDPAMTAVFSACKNKVADGILEHHPMIFVDVVWPIEGAMINMMSPGPDGWPRNREEMRYERFKFLG